MSNDTQTRCPSCGQGGMKLFYSLEAVPSNSCLLLESKPEAVAYPTGSIELRHCPECAFIGNLSFDGQLTEYSGRYEETQGFSPTFRAFHERLAKQLIDRHDLHGKKVVEIGCGKGEFLHLLCAYGDNDGLGFDPAYVEDRSQPVLGERVEFVRDFFSAKYPVSEADFVACKMTLEHIPEVHAFIKTIRDTVHGQPDSIVFVQVPEATRILKDCAFEDIYYEHCSYFTPASLQMLFRNTGFEVINTESTYDQQYLTVEARYGDSNSKAQRFDEELAEVAGLVATFPERCAKKIGAWRKNITDRARQGQRIVLWGSGSKGVAFLTTLDLQDEVEYVVDINPNRQGFFMAGTGQQIIAPGKLREISPDYVVVMNRIYLDEIREMLDGLGLSPEVEAL